MSESTPIETSLFDLFECGPGPSSSHTMGPMKAGYDFLRRSAALAGADQVGGAATGSASEDDWRFRVRLFGSLSATGAGHGTDAAVVAGLLGYQPSQCPPGLLKNLAADRHADHAQPLGRHTVRARLDDVVHDRIQHDRPYSNTLVLSLHDGRGETLLEKEYYSVGGGFIQWEGWSEPERGLPVHPYRTMRDLKEILRVSGLTLHELMLENEIAITGMGRAAILEKLEGLLETMLDSVRHGLAASGPLPGTLGVQRKAGALYDKAAHMPIGSDRFLARLNAYALATAEENADGGVIVTAPTCGAAGVMPALLYAMRHDQSIGDRALREGMLAAAASPSAWSTADHP